MSILLDVSPIAGGHGQRGIGRYVRGLLAAIELWPADRRERVWGIGLPGNLPAELDGRTFGYRSLAWRPLDLGFLTARMAMGSASRRCRAAATHATDPYHPWTPKGPRRIVTAYDLIPLREPGILAEWRPNHRWGYGQFLKQLRLADVIVAISQATADDVAERLGVEPERISVVYPAVLPPPRLERHAADDDTFLFVGGLDAHKQPELAVEALARYRAETGRGRLRFIGPSSADQRRRLRDLALARHIADAVDFDGHIPDADLDEAFASARALLWMSRIEGFGLPPVEAIGRGLPVIAVDTPVARETLGDAAELVESRPEAVAGAMLRSRAPGEAMSASILARFAPSVASQALLGVYERAGS